MCSCESISVVFILLCFFLHLPEKESGKRISFICRCEKNARWCEHAVGLLGLEQDVCLVFVGALVNVPLSGARIQEEEGGSIDYSDSRNTCLHWATVYRKYDLLEQLLQRGGNPSLLNSHQETPLHLACDTYNPPIIRLLARTGGVAANKDIHRTTPLFSLMFHRGDPAEQIELVKLLLAGGYVLTEETWLNQVRNYLYDATSAGSEEANQNAALVGGQLMATHNRESVELLKSRYGVAFLQWLLDWGTNPHRLKYLCRQAIRDPVGSIDLLQKVRQLPLPLSLINYLQLDQM